MRTLWNPLSRLGRAGLAVLLGGTFTLEGLAPAGTPSALAAGITVTTLVDETTTNGLCSIREALANANADAPETISTTSPPA